MLPLTSQQPCCPHETNQVIQELEELALDPALDQCCTRDIRQQIARERIRCSLQQQDRIDSRSKLAASVVCWEPNAGRAAGQQPQCQQQQHPQLALGVPEQQDPASNQCQDLELEQIRKHRLQELQRQATQRQKQHTTGFGTLDTVQEGRLMALLAKPPRRGLLVVHLVVQGYEPCNTLDECLAAAAAQYRGTYFARVLTSQQSPVVAQLQLPHGVPALLVGRDGCLLGKAHLSQFGRDDIWEEEVLSYLHRFKVLAVDSKQQLGRLAGVAGNSAAGAGSSDSGNDSEQEQGTEGWQAPCEVCGRTYPHEHIRALYASTLHDDNSGDEK